MFRRSVGATPTYHRQPGSFLTSNLDNTYFVLFQVKFMIAKGLRGVMFWSIDTDDFRGTCNIRTLPGDESTTYPLLKAANLAIVNNNVDWNTTVFSHEYGPAM